MRRLPGVGRVAPAGRTRAAVPLAVRTNDTYIDTRTPQYNRLIAVVSGLDPGWLHTDLAPHAPTDPVTIVPRVLELAISPKGSPSGPKWKV